MARENKMKGLNVKPGDSVGSYLDSIIDHMLSEKKGIKANLQAKALEEKDKQQGLFGSNQILSA